MRDDRWCGRQKNSFLFLFLDKCHRRHIERSICPGPRRCIPKATHTQCKYKQGRSMTLQYSYIHFPLALDQHFLDVIHQIRCAYRNTRSTQDLLSLFCFARSPMPLLSLLRCEVLTIAYEGKATNNPLSPPPPRRRYISPKPDKHFPHRRVRLPGGGEGGTKHNKVVGSRLHRCVAFTFNN